jgi:hypothetical protein
MILLRQSYGGQATFAMLSRGMATGKVRARGAAGVAAEMPQLVGDMAAVRAVEF